MRINLKLTHLPESLNSPKRKSILLFSFLFLFVFLHHSAGEPHIIHFKQTRHRVFSDLPSVWIVLCFCFYMFRKQLQPFIDRPATRIALCNALCDITITSIEDQIYKFSGMFKYLDISWIGTFQNPVWRVHSQDRVGNIHLAWRGTFTFLTSTLKNLQERHFQRDLRRKLRPH